MQNMKNKQILSNELQEFEALLEDNDQGDDNFLKTKNILQRGIMNQCN